MRNQHDKHLKRQREFEQMKARALKQTENLRIDQRKAAEKAAEKKTKELRRAEKVKARIEAGRAKNRQPTRRQQRRGK